MKNTLNLGRMIALSTSVLLGLQGIAFADVDAELVAKLPDSIRESKVIKVGTPRTIPPHVYLKDDQLTGVAVELADAMEPILGVTFEFQDMQWPGIIPGLQSGAIDLSMGMISFKEDRKEILNMMPYIKDAVSLLVSAENTDITGDEKTLCGKKVGAVQASWFVDLATAASTRCEEAGLPKLEVLEFANNAGVLSAFQSRSVDAWLHTAVELVAVKTALEGTAKMVDLEGSDWATGNITLATGKEQLGLAEAIDGAMNKLIADGTYKAILDKYTVGELAVDSIMINP